MVPAGNAANTGAFGTMGRNLFRDAGFRNWDLSVFKNFTFKERYGAQFRFEAFNFPNHGNFSFPDNLLSSATFGRVTSTRTSMRSLQFGLKYLF